MIATTLEQSRKLVEIGVNTNIADCTITFSEERGQFIADKYPAMRPYSDVYNEFKLKRFTDNYIQNLIHPAWSLDALINMFPCCKDDGAPIFELTRGGYTPSFTRNWFASWRGDEVNIECNAKTAIDAILGLIVELYKRYYNDYRGILLF